MTVVRLFMIHAADNTIYSGNALRDKGFVKANNQARNPSGKT